MEHSLIREKLLNSVNNPKHKGLTTKEKKESIIAKNDYCNDILFVYIEKDNGILKKIRFDGEGCMISLSSTEILFSLIEGKELTNVNAIINLYENFILEKENNVTSDLKIFEIVRKHKSRQKCALISIDAIRKGIKN